MNAQQIYDQVTQTGYSLSYATVKRLISSWNKSHSSREVYILQEPEPGYRAEFDWCEVSLQIKGVWTKVSMAVMVLTYSLFRFADSITMKPSKKLSMPTFSSLPRFSQFPGTSTMTISEQSMTIHARSSRIHTFNLHHIMAIPMKYVIQFLRMKKEQMKRVSVISGGVHSENGPHLSQSKKLRSGSLHLLSK